VVNARNESFRMKEEPKAETANRIFSNSPAIRTYHQRNLIPSRTEHYTRTAKGVLQKQSERPHQAPSWKQFYFVRCGWLILRWLARSVTILRSASI
jgi:hypothetical protein